MINTHITRGTKVNANSMPCDDAMQIVALRFVQYIGCTCYMQLTVAVRVAKASLAVAAIKTWWVGKHHDGGGPVIWKVGMTRQSDALRERKPSNTTSQGPHREL
jgi:hypothetical protein